MGPEVAENHYLEGALAISARVGQALGSRPWPPPVLEGSITCEDGRWRKLTAFAAEDTDGWCDEVARRLDACCGTRSSGPWLP